MTTGRPAARRGLVIDGQLRVVIVDEAGAPRGYPFAVRWRADGERQVSGEMRRSGGRGAGDVVGTITTQWQSVADGLGPLAGLVRQAQAVARLSDPPSRLNAIELRIEATVTGRPVHLYAAPADSNVDQWILPGKRSDWWQRIVVYRADLPSPAQFGPA